MSCRHRGPTRCVYRPMGVGGKQGIGVGVEAKRREVSESKGKGEGVTRSRGRGMPVKLQGSVNAKMSHI